MAAQHALSLRAGKDGYLGRVREWHLLDVSGHEHEYSRPS
jgi:hypothetical protein